MIFMQSYVKESQVFFWKINSFTTFAPGEMAERSIAAVLKTVDCNRSGGSNPSFSAENESLRSTWGFFFEIDSRIQVR